MFRPGSLENIDTYTDANWAGDRETRKSTSGGAIKVGDNARIGANSVVRGTFPRQCVIVGSPGKVVKKYDDVSMTWKVIK